MIFIDDRHHQGCFSRFEYTVSFEKGENYIFQITNFYDGGKINQKRQKVISVQRPNANLFEKGNKTASGKILGCSVLGARPYSNRNF